MLNSETHLLGMSFCTVFRQATGTAYSSILLMGICHVWRLLAVPPWAFLYVSLGSHTCSHKSTGIAELFVHHWWLLPQFSRRFLQCSQVWVRVAASPASALSSCFHFSCFSKCAKHRVVVSGCLPLVSDEVKYYPIDAFLTNMVLMWPVLVTLIPCKDKEVSSKAVTMKL